MLPELSIERVFQRELDSLPVPAEQLWVPNGRGGGSAIVAVFVVGAALLLVIAATGVIREATTPASQPRGVASTSSPTLRPPASCEPPAHGADGRCTMLVPIAIRNPAFGYNLTIPGEWHETQMPPGTEPFVRDRPGSVPSLTAPFLLDRHVFTARSAQDWVYVAGNLAPGWDIAWDLDVQVWDRQGQSAVEWSRTFGPCDPAVPAFGISGCTQRTEVIRGATFVVTTVSTLRGPETTTYYLDRGDQMLILRYSIDPTVAPPSGVTPATLEGIVHSIGLV